MTHPRALYYINRFELSEVTLSFVEWCIHFGNGTCHLQVFIPQKNPPFASPNIAGLSVIHPGYWHPLLPAMLPRSHHLKNHSSFHKAPHSKLQRNSRCSSKWEWSYLLKKREREKKKKKKKKSPLSISSSKLWSSNKFKWEAIHPIHSIPSKCPMFHETWIWLVLTPSRITLQLRNTGNCWHFLAQSLGMVNP